MTKRAACLTVLPLAAALVLTIPVLAQQPSPPPQADAAPAPSLTDLVKEVSREVEEIRGWRFRAPVTTVRVSESAAMAVVAQEFDAALPPELLALRQALMRVSGLLPSGVDYREASLTLLASQTVGYYEPTRKRLSLVERADRLPLIVERMVLAHELAHALDDQQVSLSAVLDAAPVTSDAELVRLALVEGSAFALMSHYGTRALLEGRIDAAEMMTWARQQMEQAKKLADLPRGLNEYFASYICGAAFLTKRDLVALEMVDSREIGANLMVAIGKPPRSMEQVIHPDKYWVPAEADEPVVADDSSMERWLNASGLSVVHRDTLGEVLTAVLTEPRDFPKDLGKLMSATAWTNLGAIGWGGDRFFLLEPRSARQAVGQPPTPDRGIWVTAWDSSKERFEFVRSLEKGYVPAGYAVEPVGQRVAVVFFGFDDRERRNLTTRLRSARLQFSRDGRPWVP